MAAHIRRVTYSVNEVMTLAAKAARGAGAPPAQAATFGSAVCCHLHCGRDEAEIWEALEALPKGPILELPLYFMRCAEKADSETFTGEVEAPGSLFESYLDAQPCASEVMTNEAGRMSFTLFLTTPNKPVMPARLQLPDTLANHLKSLADRTLVPESDASRMSGAGAGLTDND